MAAAAEVIHAMLSKIAFRGGRMRSISAIIGSFLMMTILAAAATERRASYETLLTLARAGKDVDFVAVRPLFVQSRNGLCGDDPGLQPE